MRRGSTMAVVIAVLGMALASMSVAWACTGQPLMNLASASVGEARSHARVDVLANQAVSGPVALRWNSLDGPVLARADVTAGMPATLDATIPDAAPGVYYLVLETSAGVARSAFEVAGPAAAPAPANPWAMAEPAGADRPLGSFEAGLALLGVGLVGISALTLVGVTRRRRATSTA